MEGVPATRLGVPMPDEPALKFIKSPFKDAAHVQDCPSLSRTSTGVMSQQKPGFAVNSGSQDECEIVRCNDAGKLEVFYDLFLACLSLFAQNQQLNDDKGITAYLGFFSLIWSTWFVTIMFEVRFNTDSIVTRFTKAGHFGVLVAFIAISPNFNPREMKADVFRPLSIALALSRLILAFDYSSVLFHLRRYKSCKLPLAILIGTSLLSAAVYFGISFRLFDGDGSSKVYYVWYAMAAGLSARFRILTFQGTNIMERISLLTCIIAGESVVSASSSISQAVSLQSLKEMWTVHTSAVMASCIALIYVVFLIYFDWMRRTQLPAWRQLTWTLLHFPFHLAMTLFFEGCAQIILAGKMVEVKEEVAQELNCNLTPFMRVEPGLTRANLNSLLGAFDSLLEKYPPVFTTSAMSLMGNIFRVRAFNVGAARQVHGNASLATLFRSNQVPELRRAVRGMDITVANMVNHNYGLDFLESADSRTALDSFLDLLDNFRKDRKGFNDAVQQLGENQMAIMDQSAERLAIVFKYTFICAGLTLVFANALYAVSRLKPWRPAAVMRSILTVSWGIGISLLSLLVLTSHGVKLLMSGMIVPLLLIVFAVVLILSHISLGDNSLAMRWVSQWKKSSQQSWPGLQSGSGHQLAAQDDSSSFQLQNRYNNPGPPPAPPKASLF